MSSAGNKLTRTAVDDLQPLDIPGELQHVAGDMENEDAARRLREIAAHVTARMRHHTGDAVDAPDGWRTAA